MAGFEVIFCAVIAIWLIGTVLYFLEVIPTEGLAFILQVALAACLVSMLLI